MSLLHCSDFLCQRNRYTRYLTATVLLVISGLICTSAIAQTGPSISLAMTLTVDTTPTTDECGTQSSLTVGAGVDVEVCYEVTNTGQTTLTRHDLVDSELGNIFNGLAFTLNPGASAFTTRTVTASVDTTFNGTWTAYNPGPTDVASSMNSAQLTVLPPSISLAMTLTVDTTPTTDECGTQSSLTVGAGVDIEVCYEVTNTGQTTLTRHDLVDSELGSIFNDLAFTLNPGASAFTTQTVTASVDTTFNGTWTAYNPGPTDVASSMSSAQLTVLPPSISLAMTLTVDTTPTTDECGTQSSLTVGAGVDVEVCYEITNTGQTTLTRHDLVDSELGSIFNNLAFTLNPGASAFTTQTVTASVDTTFNGTWTAYNPGPTDVATAMSSAQLGVIPPPTTTVPLQPVPTLSPTAWALLLILMGLTGLVGVRRTVLQKN